jgi:hypothetical protein
VLTAWANLHSIIISIRHFVIFSYLLVRSARCWTVSFYYGSAPRQPWCSGEFLPHRAE